MSFLARRRLPAFEVAIVLAMVLGACSDGDGDVGSRADTPTSTARRGRLVERTCDTAASLPPTDCYWLEVPERRDRPASRSIRLWVAVVHQVGPDSTLPPVIDLTGGPGGTASSPWVTGEIDLPGGDSRTIVVVDQRGTGRSQPRLICPESDERPPEAPSPMPYADRLRTAREEATACRDHLISEGVDLNGYDTVENAADIVDLRRALGLSKWMVRGYSYGGRLAREVYRQDPDAVTGLLLDGSLTSSPRGLAPVIRRADEAISRLDVACAKAPACASRGGVRANLEAAEARLNDEPFLVAESGLLIDGGVLRAGLVTALTRSDLLPLIPAILADLASGKTGILATMAGELAAPPQSDLASIASGLYMVTTCADDGPETEADLELLRNPGPWADEVLGEAAHCDIWDVDTVEGGLLEQSTGDVPVLSYSGAFDPWVPPEMADEIEAAYPNTTRITVPSGGHGNAWGSDCTQRISLAFTATPDSTPDTSCVAELPALFDPSS